MGRKKTAGEFRQVGFRMPQEAFDLLSKVSEARGIDLSALLNMIIADALPQLRLWLAEREYGDAAAGILAGAGVEVDPVAFVAPEGHVGAVRAILAKAAKARDERERSEAIRRAVEEETDDHAQREALERWAHKAIGARGALALIAKQMKEGGADEGQKDAKSQKRKR